MDEETVKEIEVAIKYHINYDGDLTGRYLKIMDRLASGYKGSLAEKVCALLDDYYKEVSVKNLDDAMERIRKCTTIQMKS